MARKPSKFHTEEKAFTIFSIAVEDDGDILAMVGKTTSTNLNGVLRRHLRGEISWTKGDFSKGACSGEPRIIPLEHIKCTRAAAYQRTLCWYRILDEKGYMMIAPAKFDAQAYSMTPSTARIYRTILATFPIDDLIKGRLSPPAIPQEFSPELPPADRKMTQMNIRVQENDKNAFYRLCKANNMSQREGFLHLLTLSSLLSDNEKQTATDRLLAEKNNRIKQQQENIRELERKLKSKPKGQAADEKLKNALLNTHRLIVKYVSMIFPAPEGPTLRCTSFKEWSRTNRSFTTYPYPETAGHTVMRLDSICWGKGTAPATFLFGRDMSTGNRIKLRYYPVRYTAGLPPRNEYALPGSLWLVGYSETKNEVKDLNFFLPLPARPSPQQSTTAVDKNIPFLDDVIAEIERNKCDLETPDSVY